MKNMVNGIIFKRLSIPFCVVVSIIPKNIKDKHSKQEKEVIIHNYVLYCIRIVPLKLKEAHTKYVECIQIFIHGEI